MNGSDPRIAFSPPTIRPYRDVISSDSVAHDAEETEVRRKCFKIHRIQILELAVCNESHRHL